MEIGAREWSVCTALFIFGLVASFLHTVAAVLSVGLLCLIAYVPCNYFSNVVFERDFEIPAKTLQKQKLYWSDWLLLIPFTALWLIPLFLIGEVVDCLNNKSLWQPISGLCT